MSEKRDLADEGWTVVAFIEVTGGPKETATYFVGAGTEREAKAKVQEEYKGDRLTMVAGKLTENSLGFLKLKVDEVRSAH
jgi:hypothetical protein